MKKVFLVTAVIAMAVIAQGVRAEVFKVPEMNSQQGLMMADYGGLKYSTGNFTVNYVTAAVGPCVFNGVLFSSGGAGAYDFVDVWDATVAVVTPTSPQFRLYNITGSTGTGQGLLNMAASGWTGPRYPIKLNRGLVWRANSNAYNSIVIQFFQEQ